MFLSDNIDKEVRYNNNVVFVPINHGVDPWISAVNKLKPSYREKPSKDNKYNIEKQYSKIYRLYLDFIKD